MECVEHEWRSGKHSPHPTSDSPEFPGTPPLLQDTHWSTPSPTGATYIPHAKSTPHVSPALHLSEPEICEGASSGLLDYDMSEVSSDAGDDSDAVLDSITHEAAGQLLFGPTHGTDILEFMCASTGSRSATPGADDGFLSPTHAAKQSCAGSKAKVGCVTWRNGCRCCTICCLR